MSNSMQVIETDSANALQFVTAFKLRGKGSLFFDKSSAEVNQVLARLLLQIEGIESVKIVSDSITVTKNSEVSWDGLRSFVSDIISSYLKGDFAAFEGDCSNSPGFQIEEGCAMPPTDCGNDFSAADCVVGGDQDEDGVVRQIKDLLSKNIVPALRLHGGSAAFCDFKDGIVFLSMQGACAGCPGAMDTLKNGIESLLKYYIPEVIEVRAV